MEMKTMIERRLYEASLGGDITSLMKLLEEDPLILEKVITSFTESPLHIAAMFGHVDFANELLIKKPDLTYELDSHGFSPLHLAASRKNIDMVKLLLSANPNACSITDSEGRVPLHLAAMKGRTEAIKELIKACPEAIQVVLDQSRETILHFCVKHNRLEALKLLLEELINNKGGAAASSSVSINSKDGDGNTILHLAVAKKHLEMIKFLLHKGIEVNTLNKCGFTSLDVLIMQSARDLKDIEIGELLRGAGCVRAASISPTSILPIPAASQGQQWIPETVPPTPNINDTRHDIEDARLAEWLKNTRSSLMVVASLIATMAFQAALTPPGGLSSEKGKVGTSIVADEAPEFFSIQVMFNSVGFLASLSIILLLISGLPLRRKFFIWILVIVMWIAIISMGFSFIFILVILGSNSKVVDGILLLVALVFLIIVLHFCRCMRRCCIRFKPMNCTCSN